MVIKGGSRSGGGNLAAHLLRTDTNERAEVLELHGVIADRLPEALAEMEAVATGTRCRKSLYHASINTGPGEELTLEQKAAAVARLELALGLEGHARAVVEHRKEGRDHLHVVWSRIDVDTMRATHDGHNYRKHEAVARELEREFGHNRVQGVHIERDGQPRPPRTPSPSDVQQATRTKRQLGDVGAEVTRLWRAADTGPAFATALEGAGYVLAQGDRRGYVIIDQAGGVHSLARRIEGAKTKDVNARLAGIELAGLPTADQARAMQRDREAVRDSLALPAKERPAARLAGELTRPADERAERTAVQIRADLDRHLQEQAEKRPRAPETARGEAERPVAPEAPIPRRERAYTPPDGPGGPNFEEQVADSARIGRELQKPLEKAAAARARVKTETAKEAGRAIGKSAGILGAGFGKAAGGLLGLLGGLFGAAAGAVDQATKTAPAASAARPEARPTSAPVRATRPATPPQTRPRPPSVFDEINQAIKEKEARQPGGAQPAPSRDKERDRGRGMEFRPIVRLAAIIGQDTTWVAEAKRRLIAYSERTGMAILEELRELDGIIHRALFGPA